ncbi:hypothetical protein KSF78_0001102, partial [Schistosoma japonicum]
HLSINLRLSRLDLVKSGGALFNHEYTDSRYNSEMKKYLTEVLKIHERLKNRTTTASTTTETTVTTTSE